MYQPLHSVSRSRTDLGIYYNNGLKIQMKNEPLSKSVSANPKKIYSCSCLNQNNFKRCRNKKELFKVVAPEFSGITKASFDLKDCNPSRPSSACCILADHCPHACGPFCQIRQKQKNYWYEYPLPLSKLHLFDVRKNKFKSLVQISDSDRSLSKFERSLKLLGFEPSEFGINSKCSQVKPYFCKTVRSSTVTTKTITRSISLDCLREKIRKAWIEDGLDESHRKLLAQAAYEEWYFKKNKEIFERNQKKKLREMKVKEERKVELEKKEKKTKEEFDKWINRKKRQMIKDNKNDSGKVRNILNRIVKSKDEIEEAFAKWKNEKDKELENRNKEKKKENEKKLELQRQQKERKNLAEKVFLQWKSKFEEKRKEQMKKNFIQNEYLKKLEQRKKENKQNQISYEIWKAIKDEQIKNQIQQNRCIKKVIEKERLIKLEERMYEADKAFELWLEKLDYRNQNKFQYNVKIKNIIPWIPI